MKALGGDTDYEHLDGKKIKYDNESEESDSEINAIENKFGSGDQIESKIEKFARKAKKEAEKKAKA